MLGFHEIKSQGTDGRMEVERPGSQADYYLDLRKATVVGKNKQIFPQMVVNNGDESHGIR